MKILNIFSLTFIFLLLLTLGCSNSETSDTTTDSTEEQIDTTTDSTEEQIDTLQSKDEKAVKADQEKHDEKSVNKETKNTVVVQKKTTEKPVQKPSESPEKVDKETKEESNPKKEDNYNFIITNEGKQVADNFKGDLMTFAAEEVYIEKKGKCGNEDCGKKIILVNMNQEKSIEIIIGINWKENDTKISKKRSYRLKESQKLEIGCSSMCNENKTAVKWQIIGAIYAN